MPDAEWISTDHPQLPRRKQPEDRVYDRQQKKAFGAAGLGFYFSQTADSLVIEGIMVYLKKDRSRLIAPLQQAKHNRIE